MATTTLQRKPEASASPESNQPSANGARRKIALRPEEGWTTFFLLALVLYSAVWSIQVVGWVAGLGVLTWTTGAGLVLGLISAKQQRVPRLGIHALMMALGILFAFWGTANAAFGNNVGALWTHFIAWLQKATTPNTDTNDDVMFLLFLAVLSFILAYVSIWLVVRTRRPWLVALATAIVLLINLSYSPDGNVIYLIIFLLATLLLLVRFNLVEAYRQWRRRSLRHTPDLGWDFMMAGMLFSVGILILSWLLPTAGTNDAIANAWNNASNPWVAAQQFWSNLFQVSGGGGSSAYFSNSLQLTGNVDLPNKVILTYTSQQPDQYLVAVTQDFFDGHGWAQTTSRKGQVDANTKMTPESQVNHQVQQTVRLVNPPGGIPYLFAADQPASFNLPIAVTRDPNGNYTSWYARQPLVKGEQYTATSYVSSASEDDLRQVPFPALSDGTNPLYFYPPSLLSRYLQVPNDLKNDQEVQQMLHDWTDTSTTMYDKALALENQLRSRYTYSQHNDNPPSNEDAVAWFLKTEKKGFCTFFASAMVMLARMLGMPARVASGYTNGSFDQDTKLWTVKGTDAHTWAQIYFAGYGWINFEPSAGFSTFIRPVGSQTPSTSETPDTGTTPQPHKTPIAPPETQPTGPNSTSPGQQNETTVRLLLGAGSLLALLLLVLGATSFWWRRLFRGLSPVAQTFGRVTLLASWAGFQPKRTQTPFEYIEELQQRLPAQAEPLQRLGELYVRERWSPPTEGTGLRDELLRLWMSLRGGLVRAVVRRPPLNPLTWARRLGQRRRGSRKR
jgi:transglutaminase-like putative cysteine protease